MIRPKPLMLRPLALIALATGLSSIAQTPAPATTPTPAAPAGAQGRGRGGPPEVRDPHTAGYVTAKELADGQIPAPTADGNFIIGPTHPAAPELVNAYPTPPPAGQTTAPTMITTPPPDPAVRGKIFHFTMESTDSKFYPGVARDTNPAPAAGQPPATPGAGPGRRTVSSHPAPYTRKVAVYVPKEYVPGTVAPVTVGADGPDNGLFLAVDSLIAQHRIPVMIVVSIGNGSGDGPGSERGLEYDTMSGKYAEFVEQEVLPRAEKEANVKLSKDPDARATTGGSSGGSVALGMAWFHNDLYHRVLTYSGTYVNNQFPVDPNLPQGAFELEAHLIPSSPVKPIRIWMEVGDMDNGRTGDPSHDWVVANEMMAKVLADKGYHYQFVFARNARHVDRTVKAQTYPEALEYVWQGYPIATKSK